MHEKHWIIQVYHVYNTAMAYIKNKLVWPEYTILLVRPTLLLSISIS